MRSSTATWIASLVGLVLLSSCGLCARCPDLELTPLASGSYRSLPASKYQERDKRFAHHGATEKVMRIDRAKGIVEFRYRRAGKKVVERWRIKDVRQSYR